MICRSSSVICLRHLRGTGTPTEECIRGCSGYPGTCTFIVALRIFSLF